MKCSQGGPEFEDVAAVLPEVADADAALALGVDQRPGAGGEEPEADVIDEADEPRPPRQVEFPRLAAGFDPPERHPSRDGSHLFNGPLRVEGQDQRNEIAVGRGVGAGPVLREPPQQAHPRSPGGS